MIDGTDQFDRFFQLAQLPAGDPARMYLEAQLPNMPPAQQAQWQAILQETDQLHAALAQSAIPSQLQQSLLNIPLTHVPTPWWSRMLHRRVGWMHLTAIAIVAALLVAFYNWPQRPPPPLQPLDNAAAQRIALFAVGVHEHPALQIASDDPAKVQGLLAAQSAGLDPTFPQPSEKLQLLGGGTTRLGNATALFTRWRSPQATYTLFELDGQPLGMPPAFTQTTASPPAGSTASSNHYRVVIWPSGDGRSDWALVLENDSATNCFMDSCR